MACCRQCRSAFIAGLGKLHHTKSVTAHSACKRTLSPAVLRRQPWKWYHRCVGYSLLLLGLANAYIGFHVGVVPWGWYLGLAFAWSAVAFAAGAKLLYDLWRLRHSGAVFVSKRGEHKRTGPSAQIA